MATTHPHEAYCVTQQLPDEVLAQLARLLRENKIPMNLHHDKTQDLNARVIAARVVSLDDGYKAVDAEVEVDSEPWKAFEARLKTKGFPGGISLSIVDHFDAESEDEPAGPYISIIADAAHFSTDEIRESSDILRPLGDVRKGSLYQFADIPSCRIIVELVQQPGLPPLATYASQLGIGVVAGLIAASIEKLLTAVSRRVPKSSKASDEQSQASPTQIEIVERNLPDGTQTRAFKIVSNDPAVVERALDGLDDAYRSDRQSLIWDDESGVWTDQQHQ
jgi:hypothetical protein